MLCSYLSLIIIIQIIIDINIYIYLNVLFDKNLKEGYIDIYHTIY